MRRWRWIAGSFVVAALLAAAGGALAQSVSYVTVVGPDAAGARLEARAVHGHPCVRVSGSAAGAPTCGGLPGIDLAEPFVLETQGSVRSGAVPLGGAVRAGVARVEYVFKDGRRFAADTVGASRLPGRVGRGVRFFLLELPADARPVTRRLLDAGGPPPGPRGGPDGRGDGPVAARGPGKIGTPPPAPARRGAAAAGR